MGKEKRGQAAMEFLMTYGWAILAAVIVIAVLASFGVFSPSKYIPTQCVLSAPLGCQAVAANEGIGVQMEIRNGAGESINLTEITLEGCVGTVSPSLPLLVPDQDLTVYTIPCTSNLTGKAGDKFQGAVTVTYTLSGSTLDQTSSGSVTVGVQ